MIESHAQLEQARGALVRVENALAALRARVERQNPALFAAMSEDYRANILEIRAEIDAYLGIDATTEPVPLWMVLEGERISPRDISSRLLSEWLGNFRKAVYGVAAFLESGRLRLGGGRPQSWLLDATDPHIVALAPGSIRVGLRLPVEGDAQSDLFEEDAVEPLPQRALRHLLSVAEWSTSNSVSPPHDGDMTLDEISVAAHFAARLAPSPRSTVRTVTFLGTMLSSASPVRLGAESRERMRGLEKMLSRIDDEVVFGLIREIDLDARRVILRERGEGVIDLKCHVPEELMGSAERLLNRNVRIRGLISSSAPDTITVREISEDIPRG
ncbi:hypothetical protein [Longimicrobium sp.]|jgi:hypothetical protein|uniref:hypothetical protein n=1 Tax=Longimicrobium sp. TaxID=2029185 RepID=UPI002ED93A93